MLKILGTKVVGLIVLLVLVNAGAAYGIYEYLTPMREQKERELSDIKAQIDAKYQEVARLKQEFVLLQSQLRKFKQLEAQGFFNNQNRVKAQESFNELRLLSGLLRTKYNIESGQLIRDPLAVDAQSVVLKSPVILEIESLDDVDVYTFIKALNEKFPGSVDITEFTLDRKQNITAPILRQIGSGQPVPMVGAKVTYDWRTVAAESRLNETDTSTSEGSQTGNGPLTTTSSPTAPSPESLVSPQNPSPTTVQ